MSTKRILLVVLVASGVMLAVGIGPRIAGSAQALPPVQDPAPVGACPECSRGVTIPYPGRLSDEAGQPVADGAYDLTFALYDAETGGKPLWSEVQERVTVKGGAFVVSLGSINPIPSEVLDGSTGLTASGGARWLAVGVRGPGESGFTALTPRQRLSAVSPATPASPAAPANGAACPHDHFGENWVGSGTGLTLESTDDVGVHVSSAGEYGVWVQSAGADGVAVGATGADGVYVTLAGDDGVDVFVASDDGVHVTSAGDDGVYANTTQTNHEWGFYTPDKIYAGTTIASGGSLMFVAQNGDSRNLEAGDVVAVSGTGATFADGDSPVPLVQKAGQANSTAAVGVVYRRFVAEEEVEKVEHEGQLEQRTSIHANSTEGPVAPGDHLLIVVLGSAQVKADAALGSIRPGDLLTAYDGGYAMKARPMEVNGVEFYPPGTIIGKAMEPLDASRDTGLIWVLVMPQ